MILVFLGNAEYHHRLGIDPAVDAQRAQAREARGALVARGPRVEVITVSESPARASASPSTCPTR